MDKLRLIVEGTDDATIIRNLLARHGLAEAVDIPNPPRDDEGFPTLLRKVIPRIIASGTAPVGIIADANSDIRGRWQSLSQRLQKDNYNLPNEPDPKGTIVRPDNRPPLGIWLMPDNASTGMVEDFFLRLVPATDPLLTHVTRSIESLPSELQPKNRAKARVHTWLAWQRNDSDLRSGNAVARKMIDAHAPLALTFVDWVKRLAE